MTTAVDLGRKATKQTNKNQTKQTFYIYIFIFDKKKVNQHCILETPRKSG